MSVDTKEQGINIKDLVLEEPERRVDEFDPAKILSDDDWEEIAETEELYLFPHLNQKTELLSLIKLVAPEKLAMFDLSRHLARVNEFLRKSRTQGSTEVGIFHQKDFFSVAANAVQIFSRKELNLNIDQKDKDIFIKDAEKYSLNINFFHDSVRAFRLICPEVAVENYFIDSDWEFIKDSVDHSTAIEGWYWKVKDMALGRLLYPKRFSEFNVDFNLQSIERELINFKREDSWQDFFRLAGSLKIVMADVVRITKDGIQLINNPSPLPKTQPLPEVRRF